MLQLTSHTISVTWASIIWTPSVIHQLSKHFSYPNTPWSQYIRISDLLLQSKFIPVPSHICTRASFSSHYLTTSIMNIRVSIRPILPPTQYKGSRECTDAELQKQITETGSKAKIKWKPGELECTDWSETLVRTCGKNTELTSACVNFANMLNKRQEKHA